MADTVLDVRGVVKTFDRTSVLRGIDLSVAEHEIVVLIGASGSGKSTLLAHAGWWWQRTGLVDQVFAFSYELDMTELEVRPTEWAGTSSPTPATASPRC